MAEYFLNVERLTKTFGEVQVVTEVSFHMQRQEIFGLLGPNGAGKTTTIRMLATVLKPTAGEAIIGGHSLTGAGTAVRRLIGVCPQELALYPELSALENLVFFGRMAGLSGNVAKEAALRNLEVVGLQEVAGRRVETFSGGMKRRVNLAISLMSQPQLLFLDEPTVGIDPQSRNRIFETVEGPARPGHDDSLHYPLHGRGGPPLRPAGDHGSGAFDRARQPTGIESDDRRSRMR